MPYCSEGMIAYPQDQVLLVCLGIGLVLRDLNVIQFELVDGDDVPQDIDPAIKHLLKSKLEWAHTQVLLPICSTIAEDLRTCLDTGNAAETDHGTDRSDLAYFEWLWILIGMIEMSPKEDPQSQSKLKERMLMGIPLRRRKPAPKGLKKPLSGMKLASFV